MCEALAFSRRLAEPDRRHLVEANLLGDLRKNQPPTVRYEGQKEHKHETH